MTRRRRAQPHRARPVRRRHRRRQARPRLSLRARCPARLAHRNLRRHEAARSTTGAGPTFPSTCAPASACRYATPHIVIQFRRAPFVLFRDTPVEHLMPNQLVLHIQPEEGISLRFAAKVPGPVMRLGAVDMNFEYQEYFGKQPSTGYERLLHDCMIGDQRCSSAPTWWKPAGRVVNPMLDVWKALPPAQFPQLRLRHLGTEGGRRTAGTRRPPLEEFREMILAGDIGGTNARLAYFQPQNGHLRLVSERVFPSREHSELGEIVTQFVDDSGTTPEAACFGIAGPVRNGRVETSNLPWVIEQSRLAKQIHLPATLLINDLEASAWGIGALEADGPGRIESRERPRHRQSGSDRARHRLGRSWIVLGWNPPSRFRLRRRPRRLRSHRRPADRTAALPAKPASDTSATSASSPAPAW